MDLQLTWQKSSADLALEGEDLVIERGVTTGVIVSLFSDARADEETLPDPAADPRGWWGAVDERFGSLLWTLEREKHTPATLERAKETVSSALRWMIDEGIAQAIRVDASWEGRGVLALRVQITRGTARRWAHVWAAMEPVVYEAQGVKLDLIWS